MIDRDHDLPVKRQAELLGISRGSVYYHPEPVSQANGSTPPGGDGHAASVSVPAPVDEVPQMTLSARSIYENFVLMVNAIESPDETLMAEKSP